MKPRTGAFVGGVLGMVMGFILLADIPAAPIFGMCVFGFVGYESCWAFGTIHKSKLISRINDNNQPKDEWSDSYEEPNELKVELWAVPILMLLFGMMSLPGAYFICLRIIVCLTAAIVAYKTKKTDLPSFWCYGFIVIALIYNPLIYAELNHGIWSFLGLVCAGVYFRHFQLYKNYEQTQVQENNAGKVDGEGSDPMSLMQYLSQMLSQLWRQD